jgi:tetratricopeptide (TPR) repeat protein
VQRAYAEALFDAGRSREAIESYERSLHWAPQPWFLRNSLSRRLRLLGNDSAAVEQLRASLRQHPGQREATAELVAALLGIGEYAEARRVADSVIIVDGAPPIMVGLRKVADSAMVLRAPPGTVRVGVRGR